MAKSKGPLPVGLPKSSGGKKFLALVVAVVLLWLVVTNPIESAHTVTTVLGALRDAAAALVTFVRTVFHG